MELDTLVSLHTLLGALGLASVNSAERTRLLRAAEAASRAAERFTGRRFSPTYLQNRVSWTYPTGTSVSPAPPELALPGDLLELIEVQDAGGALITSDLQPLPEPPPHDRLQARDPDFTGAYSSGEVTVRGLWAWHDRAPFCWVNSLDAPDTAITADDTAITVENIDGADAVGNSPRFSPGMLLRLDTPAGPELMRVIETNVALQRLIVMRGLNGTAAGSHDAGASITVYAPPAEIAARVVAAAIALYTAPDRDDPAPIDDAHFQGLRALRRVRVR